MNEHEAKRADWLETGATSASTVKNSSKTPEFQHIDSYGPKAEHSQKGEINITLI